MLGLIVAVSLNVALQPCAMALSTSDEPGCPHCPPAMAENAGHRHHDGDHSTGASVSPCAQTDATCSSVDAMYVDARKVETKFKPAQGDLPLAIVAHADCAPDRPPDVSTRLPSTLPGRVSPFPPLHILYCVYLD